MQDHSLSAWARDATFGIFIHWGAYSVPAWAEPTGAWGAVPPEDWFAHNAYAEWYANTIRIEGSPAAQHHLAEFGGIPYVELLDIWRADSFDPVDWARLFRSAGADYVVPVTKHHDGIALWDAPGAGDMSTIERGPRRDLIGPLAEAVRGEGLRFGVYYSGGLDWHVTDHPPITSMAHVDEFRPVDAAYSEYATSHVRDLIERYEPCVVWNDINWPDAGQRDGTLDDLRAFYRSVVPEGIVNDRWGRMDLADYRTSEYAFDATNELGSGWEHCRGLGLLLRLQPSGRRVAHAVAARAGQGVRRRGLARRSTVAERGSRRRRPHPRGAAAHPRRNRRMDAGAQAAHRRSPGPDAGRGNRTRCRRRLVVARLVAPGATSRHHQRRGHRR